MQRRIRVAPSPCARFEPVEERLEVRLTQLHDTPFVDRFGQVKSPPVEAFVTSSEVPLLRSKRGILSG